MMRLPTSAALRATVTRAGRQATTSSAMVTRAAASTHAISNPTLANIEKRWEGMPLQEQAELWMALRDRMKENWADLTLQEKKAGEYTTRAPTQHRHFRGTTQTHLWGPRRASDSCFDTCRAQLAPPRRAGASDAA